MPAPKTKPAPAISDPRLAALADSAKKDFPETWIPAKPGDIIAGEFKRLETGMTSYGPTPLVILETEDGTERSVWLFHEALKTQFNRIRPTTGDAVAVLYLGKQKVKTQTQGRASEYHNWRVTSDKVTAETAWDALGPAPNFGPQESEPETGDIPF